METLTPLQEALQGYPENQFVGFEREGPLPGNGQYTIHIDFATDQDGNVNKNALSVLFKVVNFIPEKDNPDNQAFTLRVAGQLDYALEIKPGSPTVIARGEIDGILYTLSNIFPTPTIPSTFVMIAPPDWKEAANKGDYLQFAFSNFSHDMRWSLGLGSKRLPDNQTTVVSGEL